MPGTALDNAVDYLTSVLEQVRKAGREDIPPVRRLAQDAGVSMVTMWKALQRVKQTHGLAARPGRGIEFTPAHPPSPGAPTAHSGLKWRTCYRRLLSDINAGMHDVGTPLPGTKLLTRQCGASYRTIRKALNALASDGVLEAGSRGYSVARPRGPALANAVVLLTPGEPGRALNPTIGRTHLHYRALETELNRRGLNLVVCPFNSATRQFLTGSVWKSDIPDTASGQSTLGFVLMEIPEEDLTFVAGILRPRGRAISILDERNTGPRVPALLDHRLVRVVRIGSSALPGRAMARHLLDLEHRRFAFISPYHDTGWARNRLQGIEQECGKHRGAGVRVFALQGYARLGQFSAEVSGEREYVRRQLRGLAGRDGGPPVRAAIITHLAGECLDNAAEYRQFYHQLSPLMQDALGDRDITAWIGASDLTAFACQDFLREHGVAVPQRVSVAGFDDRDESFVRNLTSYNFGTTSTVALLVNHILDPARRRLDRCVAEPEGFVVARGSSARHR